MRVALLLAGIAFILTGAVWIGQGTGYFPYPSSSFMIDERKWVYAGVAMVVVVSTSSSPGAVEFKRQRRVRVVERSVDESLGDTA